MQTKEEHAQMMAEKFNEIMDSYSNGEISATEAVIRGIETLKFYLENNHFMFQAPCFKIGILSSALEKTQLGAQRQVLDKRFLQGCMIEGLIRFGSSKNQAYNFMFEYQAIVLSAAKESHKIFKRSYYENDDLVNQDNNSFISECCYWITEFIHASKREIPDTKKYPKAGPAFLTLFDSCKSEIKKTETDKFDIRRLRPYENYKEVAETYEVVKPQLTRSKPI